MAKGKSAAEAVDHTHDELVKEIAALKKEVADLKKELAKKSAGGADLRVDILLNHLLERQFLSEKFCKKSGLL